MFLNNIANRRLNVLMRIFLNNNNVNINNVKAYISTKSVSIGSVKKAVENVEHPEYVPRNYCTLPIVNIIDF